jgi:tetratricopeptide (TPR) repeat protein
MKPLARLAIALVLLESAVARADDPPCATTITEKALEPATGLANEARKAMAVGKFDDALQLYEGAYCLLPEPILKHGLSSAELNLGKCAEAVRDARFWVDHAAKKNAEEAVRWREEVLHQCAEVTITSTPAKATVYLDGSAEALGTAPWHGWLKSGSHTVEGRLPGHDAAKIQLEIPEEINPPLKVVLELSAQGKGDDPRVAARKLGAEGAAAYKAEDYARAVEKFNAAYRLYPAAPLLLNISRADLKLSRCADALHYAQLFKTEGSDINPASPDSPDAWLLTLERECIDAEVDSTPSGATIWIDGERQASPARTPWTGRLPVGKHKILLWLPGYQKQGAFLQVAKDSPAHLALTLYAEGANPAEPTAAPAPVKAQAVIPPVAAEKPPVVAEKPPVVAPTPAPAETRRSEPIQLFPPTVPPSSESTAASQPTRRPLLRTLGYAGIAVGGAALITAIVLGVVVKSGVTGAGTAPASRTPAQASAQVSSSDAEAAGADALYVVGGVFAAAGVPLAVVF